MASPNRTPQQTLRKLHLWLGLVAGIFIVMMGLTGAVIAFKPQFESAAAPTVSARREIPNLAAVERSIADGHPGGSISRITFPQAATEAILVQVDVQPEAVNSGDARYAKGKGDKAQPRLHLYFDSVSGAEVGSKAAMPLLDWIVDLHQNLLAGKTGRAFTGLIGAALFALSLSGLVSWFAGDRHWKRALALPRTGSWRRFNYHAHRWAGLWANALLLVASFTGIVLAYPDTVQGMIRVLSGEPEHARREGRDGRTAGRNRAARLELSAYLQAAAASVPDGVIRELRMPGRGRANVSVLMWAPGDVRPKGSTSVALDAATAKIDSIEHSGAWYSPRGFVELANTVHKNELGGMPVKAGWSFLGLVPLALFLSGAQIWWIQRQAAIGAKRTARAQTTEQVESPSEETRIGA